MSQKRHYYLTIPTFIIIQFLALFIAFVAGAFFLRKIDIDQNTFNFSIALLELYIVIFTIGIGILGFVGYQNIKNAAIKASKEYVLAELRKHSKEEIELLFSKKEEKSDIVISNKILSFLRRLKLEEKVKLEKKIKNLKNKGEK